MLSDRSAFKHNELPRVQLTEQKTTKIVKKERSFDEPLTSSLFNNSDIIKPINEYFYDNAGVMRNFSKKKKQLGVRNFIEKCEKDLENTLKSVGNSSLQQYNELVSATKLRARNAHSTVNKTDES